MSDNAACKVTTYDDGKWVRTAIVVPENGVSFDLVDSSGKRIAEINAFVYDESTHLIVDVIDKDDLFDSNRALTFDNGERYSIPALHIVSADFKEVR